ncbi:MAG: hypothetical protein CW346_15255 [Bacillaceae bacterium]|nr:hypothetical protein [Bacillaceae bacterium]
MKWKRKRGGRVVEGEGIPVRGTAGLPPKPDGNRPAYGGAKEWGLPVFRKRDSEKMEIDRFTGGILPRVKLPDSEKMVIDRLWRTRKKGSSLFGTGFPFVLSGGEKHAEDNGFRGKSAFGHRGKKRTVILLRLGGVPIGVHGTLPRTCCKVPKI